MTQAKAMPLAYNLVSEVAHDSMDNIWMRVRYEDDTENDLPITDTLAAGRTIAGNLVLVELAVRELTLLWRHRGQGRAVVVSNVGDTWRQIFNCAFRSVMQDGRPHFYETAFLIPTP